MSRGMKIISCLMTLTLIGLGISRLNYIVRPIDTDRTFRRVKAFNSLPTNSVEAIVYGSSHAFLGVDTMELYKGFGIGAYNYGTNWQKINTVKLFLLDSLRTQSPKLAIIETFYAGVLAQDTDITGEIFAVRYLDNPTGLFHYLRQCFGNNPERWLSYFMPLCAFHENWNSLCNTNFFPLETSGNGDSLENIRGNMGFAPYSAVTEVSLADPSTIEQEAFTDDAIQELDEIVSICKENNIAVLFITVPYDPGYTYSDAMNRYARERGCDYINLFDHIQECGLDTTTDFKDRGHLNMSGAKKVSDFLGQYIDEHYDLTDMRNVEHNLWETALNG